MDLKLLHVHVITKSNYIDIDLQVNLPGLIHFFFRSSPSSVSWAQDGKGRCGPHGCCECGSQQIPNLPTSSLHLHLA